MQLNSLKHLFFLLCFLPFTMVRASDAFYRAQQTEFDNVMVEELVASMKTTTGKASSRIYIDLTRDEPNASIENRISLRKNKTSAKKQKNDVLRGVEKRDARGNLFGHFRQHVFIYCDGQGGESKRANIYAAGSKTVTGRGETWVFCKES